MKTVKYLLIVCFVTFFVSCAKDSESLVIEDQAEIKKLTFKHESKTFTIDYKIEDDAFVLVSEFPKELAELRKNENLTLTLGEDNNLWLVEADKLPVKNTKSLRNNITSDFFDNANFFKRFGLEKLNHTCFIANDGQEAVRKYSNEYDIKKWYKAKLTSKQYFVDGNPVDYTVDLTFGFTNGNQIEIMEADATQDNIFGNFLKEKEGLHHLGFGVTNVENTEKVFNENGYNTVVSGLFKTKLGLVSKLRFFDTRSVTGSYTEIVEAKLLGFNVTQDESLLIFGVILGDAEVIRL